MFRGCYSNNGIGMTLISYPDGGPYMEQPVVTLEMFDAILEAMALKQEHSSSVEPQQLH